MPLQECYISLPSSPTHFHCRSRLLLSELNSLAYYPTPQSSSKLTHIALTRDHERSISPHNTMADNVTSGDPALNKEYNNNNAGSTTHDHAATGVNGQNLTSAQRARYDYGGNPLAHMNTGESGRFPAFGGEFQPGLYKPTTERKFANPAPLGLSAFALTTFVLSLINIGVRGLSEPNIIVSLAFGYGGLVQLLAGMWYVLLRSAEDGPPKQADD